MKILKNKTYKNLLLKIKVLEEDKIKLQKKCDLIQLKLNATNESFTLQRDEIKNLKDKNIKIKSNLDDQTDFVSSLNERVQKAEAKIEEYRVLNTKIEFKNKDLIAENVELKSKLSRKGTGVKGSKKKEVIFNNESDNSGITEVEFEEQKYIEITSLEQLQEYVGYKFECILSNGEISDNIFGDIVSVDEGKLHLLFDSDIVGWSKDYRFESTYNKVWFVDAYELIGNIKSLKILL